MKQFGIALSGGGFRGTLYHLGVVRFLHDARLLKNVSHITSVSGGSILGAHLALNWDRYCGSDDDFDKMAAEVIRYTQLDVRNRIVRRFPFMSSLNTLRRMVWIGGNRKLTRPGLLESYYERFLYGDVPLSKLPERPQLHILSTNLSEGCLCSFNRRGLMLQRRASGKRDRFERIRIGLATVPMAVAASSAFPGFFPPLELDGWTVGADRGEFDRQAFTDGGVYDNLGLRMFRCIEQSWIQEATPPGQDDLFCREEVVALLRSASTLPDGSPVRELTRILENYGAEGIAAQDQHDVDAIAGSIVRAMWEAIRNERLYREPAFQEIELLDPAANSLFQYLRSRQRDPDLGERWWINRLIIEAILHQVIGRPCLRPLGGGFTSILVSDAGGKFKVASDGRAGGLVKTALRSTDILMDRVWQLELEAFENKVGLIACPISAVIEKGQDEHAIAPELQRQAARIRTDMDRFSDLEVKTLIMHGYCVARAACRQAGVTIPEAAERSAPWCPRLDSDRATPGEGVPAETADDGPTFEADDLNKARELRKSSRRRTWSTVFSLTDWPTYVWIPLIVCVLSAVPYFFLRYRRETEHQAMVLSAVSSSSPLYRTIVDLLRDDPAPPPPEVEFVEVDEMGPPYTDGFDVVTDSRIYDLRGWLIEGPSRAHVYNRTRVRRVVGATDAHLRLQYLSPSSSIRIRCLNESLSPQFSRLQQDDGMYRWEMDLNLEDIPPEHSVDLSFDGEVQRHNLSHSDDAASFGFTIGVTTGVVQVWILMPTERRHERFAIFRHPIGQPEMAEEVSPDSRVDLSIGAIATFRLVNPTAHYHYECRWTWADDP